MEDKIKIGLFGGTFDPIHNGHLQLASWIQKKLTLTRIIFIPASIPPQKQHIHLTEPEHRYRMVQLAVENYQQFDISDIEIKKKGISYTIETVVCFRDQLSLDRDHLFLIIGADSLIDFQTWREPNKIIENARLVVLQRPQVDLNKALPEFKKQAIVLPSPLIDISATDIRRRVNAGDSISHLVPIAVEHYIYEHELYRTSEQIFFTS